MLPACAARAESAPVAVVMTPTTQETVKTHPAVATVEKNMRHTVQNAVSPKNIFHKCLTKNEMIIDNCMYMNANEKLKFIILLICILMTANNVLIPVSYSSGVPCRNLCICGDIHPNPGPTPPSINQSPAHPQLHLGHVNIRSVTSSAVSLSNAPISKLELLSHHLQHYKYDVMGVSETWLDGDVDVDLSIPGFNPPIRRDFNRHQRGVMVYIASNLPARRRDDLEPRESEIICVEIQSGGRKILVCNCYRVQHQNIKDFCNDVESLHDQASTLFDDILVMGDFNARHREFWSEDATNAEGREVLARFNQMGMKQVIHEPTRQAGISQSCIDLIFASASSNISDAGTRDKITDNCDHLPVYVALKLKRAKPKSFKRMVWNFSRGDFDGFRNALLHAPWQSCYSTESADESAKRWSELLLACAEQFIPHYEATIRPNDKPFMTSEIRRLMRHRDRLHRLTKTNNDPQLAQEATVLRNRVVTLVRKEKENQRLKTDQQLIQNIGSKQWWSAYKRAVSSASISSASGPLMDEHGKLLTDPKCKAHLLNQHFVAQATTNADDSQLPYVPISDTEVEPFFCLPEDVFKILKHLNSNKATGPDGIGNKILSEAAAPLALPLSELFNHCLSLRTFPKCWKIAQVVPLHKKDDPTLCNNYRPISLLPCLSKVFEKLIFNHLYNYLQTNRLLSPHQSGFIQGDSTINQLMTICHNISKHLDQGEEVIGTFLDMTKAFDRVWHRGLLVKLNAVGIRGRLYDLLSSYISDRCQFVTIEGSSSETLPIHAGVPQGSVLGPLLFLVFINDISIGIHSNTFLFADDTSLFTPIHQGNADTAVLGLNRDLERLNQWANTWHVSIHPLKTTCMLFSCKHNPSTLPAIKLSVQSLDTVQSHPVR